MKKGSRKGPPFVYGHLQRTQQMAHCSTLLKQIASHKARKGEVYWTYISPCGTRREAICLPSNKQWASCKARKGDAYWTYTQRVRTAREPLRNAADGPLPYSSKKQTVSRKARKGDVYWRT